MAQLRLAHSLSLLRPTFLATLSQRILAAAVLARSRRALRHLDDHLLRDIGLTRTEALTESERASWDAPMHWRD